MQFVKTHMISLICGALGLVFIGAAALGMMQDSVKIEMDRRAGIERDIGSMKNSPKNQDVIKAEVERGRLFDDEFKAALAELEKINKRKPLIEGVFPSTKATTAAFDFKAAYHTAALNDLTKTMRAGDLPGLAEINEEARIVEDLKKHEVEMDKGGGAAAPAISAQAPPVVAVAQPMGGHRQSGGGGAQGMSAGAQMALGGDPKYNPMFRAQVNKARSIRVYAPVTALHVSPIISQDTDISPEDMWYAQVGLWVQQDVAAAIAAVNEAAGKLTPEGVVNVETAPVKRLERVFVYGYQTGQGLLPFPAADAASVTGATSPGGTGVQSGTDALRKSFLGTTCNEEFDVVRFTMTVIVDQRDILALIDALTKQNFCKCTYLSFAPAPYQEGYMYGADPVVRVVMDFEMYFARAFYAQWMPTEVKTRLGAQPQ